MEIRTPIFCFSSPFGALVVHVPSIVENVFYPYAGHRPSLADQFLVQLPLSLSAPSMEDIAPAGGACLPVVAFQRGEGATKLCSSHQPCLKRKCSSYWHPATPLPRESASGGAPAVCAYCCSAYPYRVSRRSSVVPFWVTNS